MTSPDDASSEGGGWQQVQKGLKGLRPGDLRGGMMEAGTFFDKVQKAYEEEKERRGRTQNPGPWLTREGPEPRCPSGRKRKQKAE